MLRPSYSELMDTINDSDLADRQITSRYTIVLAAAKRARQIIDGAHPLTYAPTDRAVSIAVNEMSEGKLMIDVKEDMPDSRSERARGAQRGRLISHAVTSDALREDLKDKYDPDAYTLEDDEGDDPYGEHGADEKQSYAYGEDDDFRDADRD